MCCVECVKRSQLTKCADPIEATDEVINAVNCAREQWQRYESYDRTGVASSYNDTEHPVETCGEMPRTHSNCANTNSFWF